MEVAYTDLYAKITWYCIHLPWQIILLQRILNKLIQCFSFYVINVMMKRRPFTHGIKADLTGGIESLWMETHMNTM